MNNLIPIKLAVTEDQELYRDGLIARLLREEHIEVVGQFENGRLLLDFLKSNHTDIILMDINMPVMDGIEATRYIAESHPEVKVIALTMSEDDNSIIGMLEAGASGYLLKNTNYKEMVSVIDDVFLGKKTYCKTINSKIIELLSKYKFNPNAQKSSNELTGIEFSILKLLCQSYSAKEIGEVLKLSDRTVEGYKARIAIKFDVKTTLSMVIYALKNKLIDIKDLRC